MDSFTVIHEYNNHIEAELAKGLLSSNGIESFIHSDDCGGMAGGQTFIRGVQLLVSENDMERARKILNIRNPDLP